MSQVDQMIGKRYGRLTVIKAAAPKGRQQRCHYRCDCGTVGETYISNILRGNSKSCGCLKREVTAQRNRDTKKTHGKTGSPEHGSWGCMWHRVRHADPSHPLLRYYVGVTVCKEWESFERFLADMGPRPKGGTLDRIDSSKGYCKENCRWATKKQQAENRKSTIVVDYFGEETSLAEACRRLEIPYGTVRMRIRRGRTPLQALVMGGKTDTDWDFSDIE